MLRDAPVTAIKSIARVLVASDRIVLSICRKGIRERRK